VLATTLAGEPTMSVNIAGIEFDNTLYDRDADVLCLHVGDPASAVDFDATPEGHHARYGSDGTLLGLTIVNARRLLEQDGEIVVTLREQQVRAAGLAELLAA